VTGAGGKGDVVIPPPRRRTGPPARIYVWQASSTGIASGKPGGRATLDPVAGPSRVPDDAVVPREPRGCLSSPDVHGNTATGRSDVSFPNRTATVGTKHVAGGAIYGLERAGTGLAGGRGPTSSSPIPRGQSSDLGRVDGHGSSISFGPPCNGTLDVGRLRSPRRRPRADSLVWKGGSPRERADGPLDRDGRPRGTSSARSPARPRRRWTADGSAGT